MRVGFLGTGSMGTPMGLRMLAAGHELSVWNRSEGRAKPLIHEGAIAAGTPAEAELGADAVVTMLSDDEAYEQVLFGPNGLADALSRGGLHISCSTMSVGLSERLTEEYGRRGVDFVAAPVFGGPRLAEEGRLWVVAAGADHAVDRARPLLEAISRGITVVGKEPRQAHAIKLGGMFLTSAMMYALAEAFVYAEHQGVKPHTFFEAVNDGLFESPFYAASADLMLHPDQPGAENLELGAKDLRMLREAALSRQTRLKLADLMAGIFAEARRAGPGDRQLAASLYGVAQHRAAEKVVNSRTD